MSFYRRRLPHWHPEGVCIFLTWRLHGTLPRNEDLAPMAPNTTEGQIFVALDRHLDRASTGPTWLKDPRVAVCVVEALYKAERWKMYELHAWVIMSNHVHVLLNPLVPVWKITRAVKNVSARDANLVLERTGNAFWQDEFYDHWVRDSQEFKRIVRYIEANPMKAGLVNSVEEWPWSSANARFLSGQVGDLPHGVPDEKAASASAVDS
jgi:putative transposase